MATAALAKENSLALDSAEDTLFEVVNGQRRELPPMGVLASLLASELSRFLGNFTSPRKLGTVVVEVLFRLGPDAGQRRPDVAFVDYKRWSEVVPENFPWDVVPNLAVEVVSVHDLAGEIETKIVEYFQSGVELVWVVHPPQRRIYVHESLKQVSVRDEHDELDGGSALPGFRLKLGELFAVVRKPA